MSPIAVVGVLGVAVLLWGVLAYNRLVRLRVRAEESWRDIDTQLKRRCDLLPNLVAAVQGYASHESEVFERVTTARARSIDADSPRKQAEAEEGLKRAMKSLFAVVEAYPQLQASENFMQLQQTLEQVEDAIQRSRRYYNAVVRDFNLLIQVFPRNFIAGMFGFRERQFYALSDEIERTSPQVRFK
ncbi:LemA family protein [Candidatus Bipolaricaulota bacterium]|nr:LemA family protein [Candidatus Bipolaricaulota bacterium]